MGVAAAAAVAPALPSQLGASTNDASDWREAIPGLYLKGYAVQGEAVTLPSGVRWAPTISRIERNGTFFAFFALPTREMFAVSENDGIVFRVVEFYNTSSWRASNIEDYDGHDENFFVAIWEVIKLLAIIAMFLLAAAVAVLALIFILMSGSNKGGKKKTQIDIGAYTADMSGPIGAFNTDPRFREKLHEINPQLPARVAELGFWQLP
jgi:hypothetical protein